MPDHDQAMRNFVATLPVPEFAETAFRPTPPLEDGRVVIVTSAALYREGTDRFAAADVHFETIPDSASDLKLGHFSPNFDRAGFAADLNVVYPVDRLRELAERGAIGSVADFHYAFAGNQPDTVSEVRLDTGPACAQKLLEDGVNVVVLTPVAYGRQPSPISTDRLSSLAHAGVQTACQALEPVRHAPEGMGLANWESDPTYVAPRLHAYMAGGYGPGHFTTLAA